MIKLCIDCKFHKKQKYSMPSIGMASPVTYRDKCLKTEMLDPVDGAKSYRDCQSVRRDLMSCAPQAKWFESKNSNKLMNPTYTFPNRG